MPLFFSQFQNIQIDEANEEPFHNSRPSQSDEQDDDGKSREEYNENKGDEAEMSPESGIPPDVGRPDRKIRIVHHNKSSNHQ